VIEAAIAAVGMCLFGYLAVLFAQVGNEQDNIACTVCAWPLYVLALYFLVRFVFWAWSTPMPFVGGH
jgi:hypothetical protein